MELFSVGIGIIMTLIPGLVWAVRQEGRINMNAAQINNIKIQQTEDRQEFLETRRELLSVANRIDAKVDRLMEIQIHGSK